MKYTKQVTINLSRDKVTQLFSDPESLKKWQPDLLEFEVVSGTAGSEGSQTKLVHKMGSRTIEMLETITENKLPETFSATYEADNVFNTVINTFTAVSDTSTVWELDTDFKFGGFMKIIGFLMPWSFKSATLQAMERFKTFAEGTAD